MTPASHLRAAGAALVLDVEGPPLPRVLHWGADPGDLEDARAAWPRPAAPGVPHTALDDPWPLTLLPAEADGWSGRPGLAWHRAARHASPRLRHDRPADRRRGRRRGRSSRSRRGRRRGSVEVESGCGSSRAACCAPASPCAHRPPGRARPRRRPGPAARAGGGRRAARPHRPLVPRARPQRSPLQHGTHLRESRRGRTGHDATG